MRRPRIAYDAGVADTPDVTDLATAQALIATLRGLIARSGRMLRAPSARHPLSAPLRQKSERVSRINCGWLAQLASKPGPVTEPWRWIPAAAADRRRQARPPGRQSCPPRCRATRRDRHSRRGQAVRVQAAECASASPSRNSVCAGQLRVIKPRDSNRVPGLPRRRHRGTVAAAGDRNPWRGRPAGAWWYRNASIICHCAARTRFPARGPLAQRCVAGSPTWPPLTPIGDELRRQVTAATYLQRTIRR
jgi:hypothetical protein